MQKRTKILATLGPASDSVEIIEGLIKAGVDLFRLNFSHGDHKYHTKVLNHIREAEKNSKRYIGVLQDICGPKIRIGEIDGEFDLKEGDKLIFLREKIIGKKIDKNSYILSINKPEVLDKVKKGEYIYLYDGNIKTKVLDIDDKIITQVENGGKLSSNKGVNFPNTILNLEIITEKDKKDMQWGAKNGVDFVAISFVQNAKDIIRAREVLKSFGSKAQVIAKIEKFDAVENIDDILRVSDGVMVARGDLGIEVPYYKVPSIQKKIIRKANAAAKPVITATQMLLSMAQKEMATRAEISDVANAVLDGTDAVMLSEESAVGKYPINVVEVMRNTIIETESVYPYNKFDRYKFNDETDIISSATAKLAKDLKVEAIISITSSGGSAKKLSRYRIKQPIYAITHDERTSRALTLAWGVRPIMSIEKMSLNLILTSILTKMVSKKIVDIEKSYIVTAGFPTGVPGSTNFIRILKKEQMEYYIDFDM